MTITRQEMLNRAVRGLAAQDWQPAMDELGCVYLDECGRRCAWGHVDPEGTASAGSVTVRELLRDGIGMAAVLEPDDVEFARRLQGTHDEWALADERIFSLRDAFTDFTRIEGLRWPMDVA